MGSHDPTLGWAVFAGVKLVGYSAVAYLMKRQYQTRPVAAPLIGLARTGIGVGFGAAYGTIAAAIGSVVSAPAVVQFLLGLIPVRLLEWHRLIRAFFARQGQRPDLTKRWRILGTLASFALDVPAIAGLFSLGNLWIC
jgi:alkylated DNA nucleotide flippase Atl1